MLEELRKQVYEANMELSIRPMPYDVQDYDIIAVGTPTWWYTMARP